MSEPIDDSAPELDAPVPDRFGEVVGWRAWQVIGSPRFPVLASVSHAETVWHPAAWTLATCNGQDFCSSYSRAAMLADLLSEPMPDQNRIPGEGCSCGLYAARSREQLIKLGYANEGHSSKPLFVGEVGFAGKVIPGSQGWRAEKGRIRKLYVPFHHWKYVEVLEELYGVPVQLDNTSSVVPTLDQNEGSQ